MKKFIYKITNTINGKIYIGQTNDLERRKSEHFRTSKSEKDKLLYYAINKYGKENFSFECIEDLCEDYNEKEKYWIKKYRSYIGYDDCNGYNATEGGEEPPIHYEEDNAACTHNQKIVDLVIYYLTDTNLTSKEISNITGCDNTAITRINNGVLRKKQNLSYPLRKEMSHIGLNERADQIIYDLLNTNLTQYKIAEKYHVGRTTVTAINNGQNHKRENIIYPIRKPQTEIKKIYFQEQNKYFDSLEDTTKYLLENNLCNATEVNIKKSIKRVLSKERKSAYGFHFSYIG